MLKFRFNNKISKITKILAVAPIILLIVGVWNIVYVDGYYIDVQGNLLYSFPFDAPYAITIDSSDPYNIIITVKDNFWKDNLIVEYIGELPPEIRTYTEEGYFVIEGPLPTGSEINMAWTPKYEMSRIVKISTDELFGIFGINAKQLMENVTENMLVFSAGLFIIEFIVHRYNRKHNQPTVITHYKSQILYIKKEISSMSGNN